jgi:hypothetical protein
LVADGKQLQGFTHRPAHSLVNFGGQVPDVLGHGPSRISCNHDAAGGIYPNAPRDYKVFHHCRDNAGGSPAPVRQTLDDLGWSSGWQHRCHQVPCRCQVQFLERHRRQHGLLMKPADPGRQRIANGGQVGRRETENAAVSGGHPDQEQERLNPFGAESFHVV